MNPSKNGGTIKKGSSTKLIKDYTKIKICRHPEHNPPGHKVFKPGLWEHTCPKCGKNTLFSVPLITLKFEVKTYRNC